MTILRATTAFLLSSIFILPVYASEGSIRAITLSSGGLAEVIREVPASGSKVDIEVPLEQVDDVLKSLVILGGNASVKQLSLGGQSPVDEVMRRMPFSESDLGSLPLLLGRLQGVKVVAEGAGRKVEGTVLGVGTSRGENGAETAMLTIMSISGGAVSVALTPDVSVSITDSLITDKIAEAAAAIGRAKADGSRRVEIVMQDKPGAKPADTVDLAYVVAAPIWKTAYRIVAKSDGKSARMQAWAVVENATGENWDDVRLTLGSGSPVTLRQRLFERYWRDRTEVAVDIDGNVNVRPDGGALSDEVARKRGQMVGGVLASAAAPVAPEPVYAEDYNDQADMPTERPGTEFAEAEAASATENDFTAAFAVKDPVDLKAGDTLSVPIVDATVSAARVALFQPGVAGSHPVAALLLKNETDTSLPPGIVTLYGEDEGFIGDAQLLGMPVGDERMVSFAVDKKVRVDSEQLPSRAVTKLTNVDGQLKVELRTRTRTLYTIEAAEGAARDVVIEHPRMAGWEFSTTAPSSSLTDTAHRLSVHVDAGGSTIVEAIDERLEDQYLSLTDSDPDYFLQFADETADEAAKTVLQSLAEHRAALADTDRQIDNLATRRQQIVDDQARLRENLQAVPEASELAKRYLTDLAGSEEGLLQIEKDRDQLTKIRATQLDELEAVIAQL